MCVLRGRLKATHVAVYKLATLIEADTELNGSITASFTVYIYSTNNNPVKTGT